MSEFLFKEGDPVYCEGFGYGRVTGCIRTGNYACMHVAFENEGAQWFTPDGYFQDPKEVKPGGFNPRLQSANRPDKPDVTSSVAKLDLRPEGSVMAVVSYRKQLIKDVAAGLLSNPGLTLSASDTYFGRHVVRIADAIIAAELGGESV